ncbi:MAG: hypothetical protein NUW01_16215 [Gemmatimonadaceae bacterium]|nr:hypothetical protein [Gemmatimonadaceae bacterium]
MAFNTTSKRKHRVAVAVIAAQLALACGGGDKLDPPVPTSVAATSTTTLQAIAGSSVAEKPSVIIKDQRGNPMANVAVNFAAVLGGGTVSGASQTTSSTGIATAGDWVLGTTAGANALTAAATGLSPLTFSATGVAGPASAIVKTSGDGQSATVGSAVAVVPAATVTDANGNPVAGAAVTFAVVAGGGSIAGGTATTGSNGVATTGSWTLGTVAGGNTMSVASGTLAEAVFTATALADVPAKLGIVTQPGVASVGAPITAAPVVHVRDQYGNLVATATGVTASLASGQGTLGGTVTVTAVAGVATFSNLVLNDFTSDGTATLRFTAPGLTPATSSSFTAYGSVLNLTIDGVYLTQSTQTYQGSVPLIAGRAGLIRVFVKASRANSAAPAVRVRLYRNGGLVQTYTIEAPSSAAPTTVNEGSLTSSWNVAVPANVMQTGLSILADVDPSGTVPEGTRSDNSFPVSGAPAALDVRTASTFKVTLVPVIQAGNGLQGDVTEANKNGYVEFARRIYPVSTYDVAVRTPYTYNGVLAADYGPTWVSLLVQIDALRKVEGPDRHFYGVIKPDYTQGGTGFGYIGLPAAIGVDWASPRDPGSTLRAITAAHEWGHNFGRLHIACGEPANPDPLYPHDPLSIGAYGYDATVGALLPLSFVDLMTYCTPRWISDYTYKAVINFRAAQAADASTSAGPRRSLLVWGQITPGGIVLEPSFEIDARPSLPTRAGPYRISATDAAGREIFGFSFAGNEIDHAPNHRLFAFVVPLPAGQARPAAIRLTANGRESVRRSSLLPGPLGNAPLTPGPARLDRIGGPRSRLEWDAKAYPMALVRDPATGQILSFARGGRLDIAVPGQELDVTFSDGVRSVRQRIPVAPR